MKTELKNIHFEFIRGDVSHFVTYEFLSFQQWETPRTRRKTYQVYYGINKEVILRCGQTQGSPTLTDAKKWLKASLNFVKENKHMFKTYEG